MRFVDKSRADELAEPLGSRSKRVSVLHSFRARFRLFTVLRRYRAQQTGDLADLASDCALLPLLD